MAARRAASSKPSAAGPGDWTEIRVALLQGGEVFLQSEHVRQAREAYEARDGADSVAVVRFDGASAAIADVLDECRSFDLLQRSKVVVLDDAEQLIKEDTRPIMERYCESPAPEATLILRSTKWRPGKLDALIDEVGIRIDCSPPDEQKAAAWAAGRAQKRHGFRLNASAATALVERIGPDLARIDAELGKLAVASPDGAVTPDLIRDLVPRAGEQDVWQIQKPFASGDPETALQAVHDAITLWREQPTVICYAANDLVRRCAQIAAMVEGGMSPWSAAGKARIWNNKEAILSLASSRSAAAWADLLRDGLEEDLRAKTGLTDAARAAERLALRITDRSL